PICEEPDAAAVASLCASEAKPPTPARPTSATATRRRVGPPDPDRTAVPECPMCTPPRAPSTDGAHAETAHEKVRSATRLTWPGSEDPGSPVALRPRLTAGLPLSLGGG